MPQIRPSTRASPNVACSIPEPMPVLPPVAAACASASGAITASKSAWMRGVIID
jgi:hypothetical protein